MHVIMNTTMSMFLNETYSVPGYLVWSLQNDLVFRATLFYDASLFLIRRWFCTVP